MKPTKNIHILPTDKPSRVYEWGKELKFTDHPITNKRTWCQNIYITSDEEIKEGDWFIRDGSIHKCFKVHKTDIEFLTSIDSVYCGSNTFWSKEFCKKIILTTDQDLIGIQSIDDDFLEWFIKNPSCEEVEVDSHFVDFKKIGKYVKEYLIIIPKEEPKSKLTNQKYIDKIEILPEQIWNEEKMEGVKKLIQKQKLIEIVKSDEELGLYEAFKNIPEPNDKLKKAFRDFGKTETLEQAAERLYSDKFYPMYGSIRRDAFINGAEWYQEQHKELFNQETLENVAKELFLNGYECGVESQERSYSNEDFKLFARLYFKEIKMDKSNLLWEDLADKCLEQFKKK